MRPNAYFLFALCYPVLQCVLNRIDTEDAMININKVTGANLRKMRETAMMTQEMLAAELGVAKQYVSALEVGRRGLSSAMLEQLCESFACAPDEFFRVGSTEPIDALLRDEIKKMSHHKKASLYAHAVAINTVRNGDMHRRVGDVRI